MAAALAARGCSRGDRLAVFLANRVEYLDLFLAAARLGVIFVPINVLYRERDAGHILRDAAPKALVVSGDAPVESGVPVWQVDELSSDARTRATSPPVAALDGDTPAALIYTSGTTGPAKGAVITHGNLSANALKLVQAWHIGDTDRLLLPLPLFHVHGLGNGVHCWLRSGCRMRLLERFDHLSAAATFLDFRPSLFFGVPTMYVRLLEVEEPVARRIGAALRLAVSGSAPLPAHVLDRVRAAIRAAHSRALRHDRDADDPRQPIRRRAPRGHRRRPLAWRRGASGRRQRRRCRCRDGGRADGQDGDAVRRILESARPDGDARFATAGSARAIWPCDPPTATTRCAAVAAI